MFVNIYAEDLYFLTTRADWRVTKIYDHYTFKQDSFKRDLVVVEKDFYKLFE